MLPIGSRETGSPLSSDEMTGGLSTRGRGKKIVRQMAHLDGALFADQVHGALDDMLQFPDIAGPGIMLKPLHHLPGNRFDLLAEQMVELADEMTGQNLHIIRPLGKGGDVNEDHAQTVKEIDPEDAVNNGLAGFPVDGADDLQVDGNLAQGTDPPDLFFLQHPQKLGLEADGHGIDLVEK